MRILFIFDVFVATKNITSCQVRCVVFKTGVCVCVYIWHMIKWCWKLSYLVFMSHFYMMLVSAQIAHNSLADGHLEGT